MTLRRLKLTLFIIVTAVALIRFFTGNIIGGVVTGIIAAALGSWALDWPVLKRLRQLRKLMRFRSSKKDED
ncbi:MAG: hypothetical protein KC503_16240 [Myxococcales bacterium]|nr:hypothetical protein [Myxococcales bacterium]